MMKLTRLTLILAGCVSLGVAQAQTEPAQPLLTPVDPATGVPIAEQATADATLQARLASLEARLGRLEKVFENQVVRELLQSVDGLQAEIRELRGEIEGQYNDMEVLQKRQRDLYRDSDRRLRDLELGLSAGAAAQTAGVATGLPEAPLPAAGKQAQPAQASASQSAATAANPSAATQQAAATTAAAAATQAAPVNEADEKAAYIAAFEFLKTGQYAEAIESYKAFLEQYPNGRYADNAQYWMGEANYVSREFQEALVQFQKVVGDYPSSPKVSDARLKIGFSLYEMQRWDDSRAALERVINDYPNTSVARLARQRIVRMKKEGH
ncbi:MAG: tol-pal system protein YbgF [Gammaproteobacteria bacterium]|nr:tol-pal system protein YbgF [Gammaproteobacteria bacterium]